MYFPDLVSLTRALAALQPQPQVRALLLWAADHQCPAPADLTAALRQNHKPLMGGVFPEIIADGRRYKTGFVLMALDHPLEVKLLETGPETANGAAVLLPTFDTPPPAVGSIFCFFNAWWPAKPDFMLALYDQFGPFVHYCGGGAGSLSFSSFPCLFANQTVAEHGAVVGLLPVGLTIGVAHGWHPLSDLIRATRTQGNTIVSLDGQPAFAVYQTLVESHSQTAFTSENFFDLAKSYPLGLVRLDDEMIIRDPYATEAGCLQLVDEVPEGEYIRLMHGNLPSLLQGAQHAVQQAAVPAPTYKLCIDCISRVLFMQDDFEREIAILHQGIAANGVLSIGEVANPGRSALELYNKAVVVAQW